MTFNVVSLISNIRYWYLILDIVTNLEVNMVYLTGPMLLYWVSYVPLWFWFSILITLIHTYEETIGEIWKSLGIPVTIYFIFQFSLLILSWFSVVYGQLTWLLVAIRILDCFVTHIIFDRPGIKTSPLLLVDAAVLLSLQH